MKKLITLSIALILLITPTFASFDSDSCINENYIKPESNISYKAVFDDYKLVEFNGLNTTILSLKVTDGDLTGQVYEFEFWIESDEIEMFTSEDTIYYFDFDEVGNIGSMQLVVLDMFGNEYLLEDY